MPMSASPDGPGRLDRRAGRSAFGTDVDGYHGARSGYPADLFEYLSRRIVPSPRILEIGAGTGLATEGLVGCNPQRLALLEPDARLCKFLEGQFAPIGAEVTCGAFPENSLPGPFDLIACAAAFHWMEPEAALARARFLLAPGGIWAMWWNCYFGHGEDDPFSATLAQVLMDEGVALAPSYHGANHYALDTGHLSGLLQQAEFRSVEHVLYRTPREYSEQSARDLCASFSFVRMLLPETRSRVLDRIASKVRDEHGGRAPGIVITSLYAASI